MSTNYYVKTVEKSACRCCGHCEPSQLLHIGKSSMGWAFALHVTDEIKSLEDWKKIFKTKGNIILDEYNRVITIEDMLDVITIRKAASQASKMNAEELRRNYAQYDRNGLLRSVIDNDRILGHGDTWDLTTGEFS